VGQSEDPEELYYCRAKAKITAIDDWLEFNT